MGLEVDGSQLWGACGTPEEHTLRNTKLECQQHRRQMGQASEVVAGRWEMMESAVLPVLPR